MTTLTDIQLMGLVRDGDDAAFETLVLRHQRGLVNYFYRLCWNSAQAEDFAQDTFLRIYEARHRYEPRSKLTTWMYRIARNLWVDHARKMARRGTPLSLDRPLEDESTMADLIESKDRGAEAAQEVKAKMERVLGAVANLSPAQRELFTMANVDGLKYREISELLDIPVGTVKTRMHSLMKKLRSAMAGVTDE